MHIFWFGCTETIMTKKRLRDFSVMYFYKTILSFDFSVGQLASKSWFVCDWALPRPELVWLRCQDAKCGRVLCQNRPDLLRAHGRQSPHHQSSQVQLYRRPNGYNVWLVLSLISPNILQGVLRNATCVKSYDRIVIAQIVTV